MTKGTDSALELPRCQRRRVQAAFSGGAITSDGGVVRRRQVDRRIGLTERLTERLPDPHDPARCDHSRHALLRHRLDGLALGYEELNDHPGLRQESAVQTAVERDTPFASPATRCRWENHADRAAAQRCHAILVEQFSASFAQPPPELRLAVDANDDPLDGHQDGRCCHGYQAHYCFLPVYAFGGEQLLVSDSRPSNREGAQHAWAILAVLVKRLRQAWPAVRWIIRRDRSCCCWRLLQWGARQQLGDLIRRAKKSRLNALAQPLLAQAARLYYASRCKHRVFRGLTSGAAPWVCPCRVNVQAEPGPTGSTPRSGVRNLPGPPHRLYREQDGARGDMENRIKAPPLELFADRTRGHAWWPNPVQLLLARCAYGLASALQRLGLAGTALATASVGPLRLTRFKVGAVVLRNTRRIRFLFASHSPFQEGVPPQG